jgi:ferredoxin
MHGRFSPLNVRIDRILCCGSAECVQIAPGVFQLDSKQKSVVIDADGAPVEKLLEAAEACPCGAIIVEDDDGNPVDG